MIYPSQEKLNPMQIQALEAITMLPQNKGRDIFLATDRTQSVRIEEEGRVRMTQIIRDTLTEGDHIYIVDFATEVSFPKSPIVIRSNDDKAQLLNSLNFDADPTKQNTDIQNAEQKIYKRLAEFNQERLSTNRPIYRQSVVWMTDAPLFTKSPATEQDWVETPSNSPFRNISSELSKERNAWLQNLPFSSKTERSHQINGNYKLTVVDIAPTVQEVCTYAPSGQTSCKVTPYLFNQLWLPATIAGLSGTILLTGLILGFSHIRATKKDWKISINDSENIKMLNRYELGKGYFDCEDSEERGYLIRRGKDLWIQPIKGNEFSILVDDNEINRDEKVTKNYFTVKLTTRNNNSYEFIVKIAR